MLQTQINVHAENIEVLYEGTSDWKLRTQIFAENTSPYVAIYTFCKKYSGKSNLIANIFLKICDPDTQLILCQGTNKVDQTTLQLREMMEKKGYKQPIVMDDIYDTKGMSIYQVLTTKYDLEMSLIDEKKKIKEALNNEETKKKLTKQQIQQLEQRLKEFPITFEENKKYNKPMFFVWLDDIDAKQLRNTMIFDLIKKGRHSKAMVVISGHDLKNIEPQTMKQLGIIFVGKKVDQATLVQLYDKIEIPNYSLNDFCSCYMDSTEQKYHFLQINVDENLLSQDFRTKDYVVEEE